jgi:hypothetical protein
VGTSTKHSQHVTGSGNETIEPTWFGLLILSLAGITVLPVGDIGKQGSGNEEPKENITV